MKLVADKDIPYLRGVLEPFFEVEYIPGAGISCDVVRDAEVLLVRTRTRCNADLLQHSSVRFIGSATAGFDHIDSDYCSSNGILWRNAPGCNAGGVQQWVGAAIVLWLETTQRLPQSLVLGVVGVGHTGSKVAELGKALGMKVLCCDPPRTRRENLPHFVNLETILSSADIISFHVPLNTTGPDKTFHMLDSDSLQRCKPNSLLINASRGEVVDSHALTAFLNANPFAHAAIDVWENEPNILNELLNRCMVGTPHIAGYSLEGKVAATQMVVDAVSQHYRLELHPWQPVPNPTLAKVKLNGISSLPEAISASYNIVGDDLRRISSDFEGYRNTYSYRRDFSGFEVATSDPKLKQNLTRVGFTVSRG
ncbi:MAG TPA: 4-phosphoerythronate dehydrogenase [Tenuifilaceae bacterium]|jgi:erythronate-4-phosphate dehydrogenase|nr:4-phosphoerythronate dehydrogenase [Bacteroidales bacterium]HOC36910.1 4-phosphoerythronate dehydrogenase [Tenuifilaceae bacterium]HOW21178.1 4-phosphoerythronate dehydrogenase [Tenuifilaceae bacterium]HOY72345.1 4-phosphoerythronate dehydrogenase [Tenuifilaceae bacterium]HPA67642.1 4-phosphoerythronate dehydrogenase [Tenuifilaceae bacterium]